MKHLLIICPALLVLSACASTPDPAKVCTAEWIAPRTERAVDRIEKRSKSSIKSLVKASETLAAGKVPGPFQMLSLRRSISSLEKELTRGKGIRDLKTVARTCNKPEIVSDAMRDLMETAGVSDRFIRQVEASAPYQRAISTMTAPDPVPTR